MILYVRGDEFGDFARWLCKKLDTPPFDRGIPLPVEAAKQIVERLEPMIARKAFLEAANIVDTHAIPPEVKGVLVAAIKKRAEAL